MILTLVTLADLFCLEVHIYQSLPTPHHLYASSTSSWVVFSHDHRSSHHHFSEEILLRSHGGRLNYLLRKYYFQPI